MGESRDAVKAASEIGVIMMGRSVQNKPSTFRDRGHISRGRPRVTTNDGWTFGSPQFLGATANSRRSVDLLTFPARGRVVLLPDRRPYVFAKPFAVSQITRRSAQCSEHGPRSGIAAAYRKPSALDGRRGAH